MRVEFKEVLDKLIVIKSSSKEKLLLVDEVYEMGKIKCNYSQEDVQQLINELSESIIYSVVYKRNLAVLITSFA